MATALLDGRRLDVTLATKYIGQTLLEPQGPIGSKRERNQVGLRRVIIVLPLCASRNLDLLLSVCEALRFHSEASYSFDPSLATCEALRFHSEASYSFDPSLATLEVDLT